jgi:type I restriction enzyme, R subunit
LLENNDFYEVAQSAENNVLVDPNNTLIKLRLYGELLSKYVYSYEGLTESLRTNQKERIDYLLKEETIRIEIYEMLNSLRIKGNKAVHEANYGSVNEAKSLLKLAFYLGAWFYQIYGEWDFDLPEYKEIEPVKVAVKKNISLKAEKPIESNTYKKSSILTVSNINSFSNNDPEYEKWLQENGHGFVFNHFSGTTFQITTKTAALFYFSFQCFYCFFTVPITTKLIMNTYVIS